LLGSFHQHLPKSGRTADDGAVEHGRGRIDRNAGVFRSPLADGIEILEREAGRIQDAVA
jgi:hypothetical protein